MLKQLKILISFGSLVLFNYNNFSQTFGFGCLGLSSFYGGYSYYSYSPDGVNEYIKDLFDIHIIDSKTEFGAAEGFVVGANFFRAQFPSFFFSAKGYYQFLFERHTYNGLPEEKIDLNLNHWGVAIDVGIPLFDLLDWKIFEGGIRFINAKLTNSITADSYESKNTELGYYFGSGVVIHAIKDYISIEGTVSYNVIKVDNIEDKNGNKISAKDNFNLIKSGSIISSLQLNIGFPL